MVERGVQAARRSSARSGTDFRSSHTLVVTLLTIAIGRTDFYQTPSTVIASFFLKKIVKETAKVEFREQELVLDLATADSPPKRYTVDVPLYATIDAERSTFKILGSKLEVTLLKADGSSWPVLRSDEAPTGEILQVGRAGRLQ